MKQPIALAIGVFLSASLIAATNASPVGASEQGLKNSKKMMQSLREREKKMREVMKLAHEKRRQAQSGN